MNQARERRVTSIGKILPKVLREIGSETHFTREVVDEAWGRVAGEEAARHSRPIGVRRGRVTVEVENSGWMYALGLKRAQLVEGLMELLGAARAKTLSLRIGERKDA